MKVVDDPNVSGRLEELNALLVALTALAQGRCRASACRCTGRASPGKVADAFNEVVEQNADMADGAGAAAPGRRQGRQAEAARVAARGARLLGRIGRVHQLADRRPRPPDQRGRARDRRGRAGRPLEEHGARGRRPAARGRVPAHREDDQQDGRAARQLLGRGDARRARGRHRGQARRPGQGEGRRRHLEGPDRLGQLDGRQPDRPGPQHRRRDDRGRQGRPLEEDRRRRQGRVPDAEEHDQHDGRPAALVRVGSDAGRARGRHRRLARRAGARRGRLRHVEGPDRLGQLDGGQPDLARCATSPT